MSDGNNFLDDALTSNTLNRYFELKQCCKNFCRGFATAMVSETITVRPNCHCERAERLSQSHHRRVRKVAFTLAEVLITLAIIGIVAALTIPTLIQNYQTRGWDTASTVFTRKLEEALKVMNTQQTLAGYKNTEDFVTELSKHIKITKICKNDDLTSCFEDKVYWGDENEEIEVSDLKTASKFGQKNWNTETVGVQFANGTAGIIAYNPDCTQNPYSNQIKPTSCLAILYDTSAYKTPNTQNKDLRGINIASLGGNSCAFKLDGICFGTPFQPTALTSADCNANKTKYGIKNCRTSDDDYWGGAMKYCADQGQRLANDSELTTLANDLYGQSVAGAEHEDVAGNLDTEKASKYGFSSATVSGMSIFYVWGGVETSVDKAYARTFASVGTNWGSDGPRNLDPIVQAVCVGG